MNNDGEDGEWCLGKRSVKKGTGAYYSYVTAPF